MARLKATSSEDYKHRDTFVFRGLTYRYNKPYGEWRLALKKPPHRIPDTIQSATARTTAGTQHFWRAGGYSGPTPLATLEAWAKGITELRRREARQADQHAKGLWAVVAQLERRSWAPRS